MERYTVILSVCFVAVVKFVCNIISVSCVLRGDELGLHFQKKKKVEKSSDKKIKRHIRQRESSSESESER